MWWLIAVVAAGCSGMGSSGGNRRGADPRADAEDALILAVGKRDPAAVQKLLRAPVELGGLWFPEPDCQSTFGAPMRVEQAQLPALARCLTELPLLRSQRKHTLYSTAIVHYEPGIELEVKFRLVGRPSIAWLGFAARHGVPTVTSAVLEAARIEGDPVASLPADTRALVDADLAASGRDYVHAWVDLCIDDTGAVTSVHPREATSSRVHEAFASALRSWKFKPVAIGGAPAAACTQLRLVHPSDATVSAEVLPVRSGEGEAVAVPLAAMTRLTGSDSIPPDDPTRVEIESAGGGAVVGAFRFCADPTGGVVKVAPVESTGWAPYDRKLEAALRTWTFKPYVVEGKPVEACSSVVFVYQQGQS